mmetsp:Transcript_3195/g.6510  ORF Transcript_3195/g.6510 Transcript_3195/m.6510 type:complete len:217 (-) Transcript_3195:1641-2291(-)
MAFLERLERKPHAPLVGNVLAERGLAVNVVAVEPVRTLRAVLVVLVAEAVGPCVELVESVRVPPVLLVAVAVQQVPGVVEAMRHLVAADGAERPEVARLVELLAVERLLDDPCRHPEAVDHGGVERVDDDGVRLSPPVALRGLVDAHRGPLYGVDADDVDVLGVALLAELSVVAEHALGPLVGVSDFEEHHVELLLCRHARPAVHPAGGGEGGVEL